MIKSFVFFLTMDFILFQAKGGQKPTHLKYKTGAGNLKIFIARSFKNLVKEIQHLKTGDSNYASKDGN